MRVVAHIIALVVLSAGQAQSLTPMPPACAYRGDVVQGRDITSSSRQKNGFVTYASTDKAEREYLYLENCANGKVLRSKSDPYNVDSDSSRHPNTIAGTLYDALASDKRYTMGDIQGLLRDQGVRTKRYTSKVESCTCQYHYPDMRGTKTPYTKAAK